MVNTLMQNANGFQSQMTQALAELRSINDAISALAKTLSAQPETEEGRVEVIPIRSINTQPYTYYTTSQELVVVRALVSVNVAGAWVFRVGEDRSFVFDVNTIQIPFWIVAGSDAPLIVGRGLPVGLERQTSTAETCTVILWAKPARYKAKQSP